MEIKNQLSKRAIDVEVQRLTRGQMLAMDLMNNVPVGESRIVALRRNESGEVFQARIVEGVDEKKFLHGDDKYYDKVLKQAKALFNSQK